MSNFDCHPGTVASVQLIRVESSDSSYTITLNEKSLPGPQRGGGAKAPFVIVAR